MKQFTTIKVGYTAGIYGCTNEYFTTIMSNGKKHDTFTFYGNYGAEERISRAMQDKGFAEYYTPSIYGQLHRNDIPQKMVMSEYSAIEHIKNNFKWDDR